MGQGTRIWEQVLTELRAIMTEANFNSWLRHTRAIAYEDGVLTVGVPTTFNKEYLEKKISHLMGKTMESLGFGGVRLRYVVTPVDGADGAATTRHSALQGPIRFGPPRHPPQSSGLNPHAVFETFVVGGSNRFAYTAAVAVAAQPGQRWNPLFMHGDAGLGQGHLLHAIGNQALRLRPDLRVRHVTAARLLNGMNGARQRDQIEAWRERFTVLDMLLIAESQIFADASERVQEEVLRVVDALCQSGKQIALTGDRHPNAISTLIAPLRERLRRGLIADIRQPDLETRIAILLEKAQSQPVPVPKPVIDAIAARVQGDIGALEGALTAIIARASLQGVPVTMELAIATLEGRGHIPKRSTT